MSTHTSSNKEAAQTLSQFCFTGRGRQQETEVCTNLMPMSVASLLYQSCLFEVAAAAMLM